MQDNCGHFFFIFQGTFSSAQHSVIILIKKLFVQATFLSTCPLTLKATLFFLCVSNLFVNKALSSGLLPRLFRQTGTWGFMRSLKNKCLPKNCKNRDYCPVSLFIVRSLWLPLNFSIVFNVNKTPLAAIDNDVKICQN